MNGKENKILQFLKKDAVLAIAVLLAVVSSCIVRPSMEYVGYIDYRVLVLLLSLMLVVGGWKSLGVFNLLGEKMCSYVASYRGLVLVLVCLCFFSSMLITNDVALITFVPFTLSVFGMIGCEKRLIPVIVLETVAANMGSMLTPIGNPQNLLLFSVSGMSVGAFMLHMLPIVAVSLVLILACVCLLKNQPIVLQENSGKSDIHVTKHWQFWIYCLLFLVCMGNVFRLYSYVVVGIIVVAVVLVVRPKLFQEVDYSLLLTFVGFFVFIGNIKQVDAVNSWINAMIGGNELTVGILASQVISNMPAAMLLSGFTKNYKELLYGVNIGGLGTLIASMASLISYRLYGKAYPEKKREYFLWFTAYSVGLLVILYGLAIILD